MYATFLAESAADSQGKDIIIACLSAWIVYVHWGMVRPIAQMDIAVASASDRPSLVQLRAALDGAGLRVTKHHDLTAHFSQYMHTLGKLVSANLHEASEVQEISEMVQVRSTYTELTVYMRRPRFTHRPMVHWVY